MWSSIKLSGRSHTYYKCPVKTNWAQEGQTEHCLRRITNTYFGWRFTILFLEFLCPGEEFIDSGFTMHEPVLLPLVGQRDSHVVFSCTWSFGLERLYHSKLAVSHREKPTEMAHRQCLLAGLGMVGYSSGGARGSVWGGGRLSILDFCPHDPPPVSGSWMDGLRYIIVFALPSELFPLALFIDISPCWATKTFVCYFCNNWRWNGN